MKDTVKSILDKDLSEIGVLAVDQEKSPGPTITGLSQPLFAMGGLTFEQQRELFVLKLEHKNIKHNAEIEKQ